MKKKRQQFMAFMLNVTYFLVVFVVALSIATLALVRRLNSYQATNTPFVLQVQKEELETVNTVAGLVKKIHVKPGQHVKKGDLLVELVDETAEGTLQTDQVASRSVSARKAPDTLKSLNNQYEIRAPRDGIIYKVDVAEDTYLKNSTKIITMFSDDNAKLVGTLSPEQYLDLIKQKRLDVFSARREQIFGVKLEGVSRVTPATRYEASKYELYFQFVNEEDAAGFIQGENLDVVAKTRDKSAFMPANLVTSFWNSLISVK